MCILTPDKANVDGYGMMMSVLSVLCVLPILTHTPYRHSFIHKCIYIYIYIYIDTHTHTSASGLWGWLTTHTYN
jgi:hypothetical protein